MAWRRTDRLAAALRNFSLTAKGVFVVAVPVAALLLAVVAFSVFEDHVRIAQEWVEHTYQVRSEISRTMLLLARAEALDRYPSAAQDIGSRLDTLARLTADNPAQCERVAALRARIVAALADPAGMRREGAQLSLDLEAMRAEEDRLLRARRASERGAQRMLELAVFSGGAVGLLGAVLAALLFTTGIVKRVHRLEADAKRMAAGVPIEEPAAGGDELTRLARTLRETSALLAAQREELRAAHSEMERRVEKRTGELHSANAVLHALIQASPLAIWALDRDGNVTFWNPAAERTFGYTEAEVIHRPPPVVPPELSVEYAQWLDLFRTGGVLSAAERVRCRKDGSRIDVLIWTAPLLDAQGQVNGTLVIDSDVTDRKLLEEQFRQSQKLEAVGRLAGGVAHDFNNLLTVILGYVEMILTEAEREPFIVEYAREVQQAAARAGALTAQLLTFSRRQMSHPQVLDLNQVVSESMRMLRRVIGEDIEIATHLDRQLGRVNADPVHIDQVLMNLVVNARDAMGSGGHISIDTANVQLDEHYSGRHIGVKAGAYALLAVSDTGSGMSTETKSRLFEPFFTTKEAGKGTGLGLAIVYGIVKQNGGEIMVYSEEGEGTTFKIYLPLTQVPVELAETEAHGTQLRGTETILLCEDEDAIRRLVESILSKQGYRILEAETPDRALEICQTHSGDIDLLLTDVVMPRMSGFELAKEVETRRPDTKVLYMSGYTDSRVSAGWVLDPSRPFLHKPFTVAALGRKVREALGGNTRASS